MARPLSGESTVTIAATIPIMDKYGQSGRSNLLARVHIHSAYVPPRFMCLSQEIALAAPPAKKNSGTI